MLQINLFWLRIQPAFNFHRSVGPASHLAEVLLKIVTEISALKWFYSSSVSHVVVVAVAVVVTVVVVVVIRSHISAAVTLSLL